MSLYSYNKSNDYQITSNNLNNIDSNNYQIDSNYFKNIGQNNNKYETVSYEPFTNEYGNEINNYENQNIINNNIYQTNNDNFQINNNNIIYETNENDNIIQNDIIMIYKLIIM